MNQRELVVYKASAYYEGAFNQRLMASAWSCLGLESLRFCDADCLRKPLQLATNSRPMLVSGQDVFARRTLHVACPFS